MVGSRASLAQALPRWLSKPGFLAKLPTGVVNSEPYFRPKFRTTPTPDVRPTMRDNFIELRPRHAPKVYPMRATAAASSSTITKLVSCNTNKMNNVGLGGLSNSFGPSRFRTASALADVMPVGRCVSRGLRAPQRC